MQMLVIQSCLRPLPHGQRQRMVYDPVSGRLSAADFYLGDGAGASGTLLSGYRYKTFTKLGQRDRIDYAGTAFSTTHSGNPTAQPETQQITYNETGEVWNAEMQNSNSTLITDLARSYLYDEIGNRKTLTEGAVSTAYTPTSLNQYSAISTRPTPLYDNNGSLEEDGLLSMNGMRRIVSFGSPQPLRK